MRKLIYCLTISSLVACGSPADEPEPEGPATEMRETEVTSVVIESEPLEMALGDTAPLRAKVLDQDGNKISGVAVEWSAANGSVIEMTPEGVAIAVGAGATSIEARAGDVVGTLEVSVRGEDVASIEVGPQSSEPISVGAYVRISVSLFDRFHAPIDDPRDVLFTSTNEAVLTVSDEGLVRAVGEGTASIEVEVEGFTGSVEFTVVPPVIRTVELSQSTTSLVPGDSATLEAVIYWNDDVRPDYEPEIVWSVESPEIATIDAQTGLVTALQEGRTAVTATIDGTPYEFRSAVEVVFDFGTVSAGGAHACGLVLDVAFCWGANDSGQLGRASGTNPARVETDLRFRRISAGGEHTCGLTNAGQVYCWGDASTGQLGGGLTNGGASPALVAEGMEFKSVIAGDRHSCALTIDDELYCWGEGSEGRLGIGQMTMQNTLQKVGDYVSYSVGFSHSCALTAGGEAHCWGANGNAQLGLSTAGGPDPNPQVVQTAYDLTTIVTGATHTCAISLGGETLCWGGNGSGQVGDGTFSTERPNAALVSPNILDRRLSAGPDHTCGLTRQGEVQCWGEGDDGRLGTGATDDVATPTVIEGSRTYFTVDAGTDFTCAVSTGSDPYCWGAGADGQLGAGSSGSLVPVRVTGF